MCAQYFLKFINLAVRDASKHSGINIKFFYRLAGIYITRNIQIVTVSTDFITRHCTEYPGIVLRSRTVSAIRLMSHSRSLLFPFLYKTLRGIDNQHIVIVTMLLEHHDEGRDTCAKEDIGRQSDNGIDVVLFNQVTTDFAFPFTIFIGIATEENS